MTSRILSWLLLAWIPNNCMPVFLLKWHIVTWVEKKSLIGFKGMKKEMWNWRRFQVLFWDMKRNKEKKKNIGLDLATNFSNTIALIEFWSILYNLTMLYYASIFSSAFALFYCNLSLNFIISCGIKRKKNKLKWTLNEAVLELVWYYYLKKLQQVLAHKSSSKCLVKFNSFFCELSFC